MVGRLPRVRGVGLVVLLMAILSPRGETIAQQGRLDIQTSPESPAELVAHALSLLEGNDVPRDPEAAAQLAYWAAEAGNTQAMLLLSAMVDSGVGLPMDPGLARLLLDKAADAGLPEALYYRAKLAAETNPGDSLNDLRRAGAQGYEPALQVLATLDAWEQLDILAPNALPDSHNRNLMIAIQALLLQLGYDPGFPDGRHKPETSAAIAMFQVSQGMDNNPAPSAGLRDKLVEVLRDGQ